MFLWFEVSSLQLSEAFVCRCSSTMSLLIFPLLFAMSVSVADRQFGMVCTSRFAIGSDDNLCLGAPLECTVTLDSFLCVEGRDNFSTDALEVSLFDQSPATNFEPTYNFTQTDSLLSIVLNYIPQFAMSIISFEVEARVSSNCSFFVTDFSTVQSSRSQCLYPLLFELINSNPAHPAVVKGGDIVEVELRMVNINGLLVEQLSFCLDNVHPALALVSYTFALDDNEIITETNSSIPDSCILEDQSLQREETLFANLIFRVQPFVLPQAKLYSSFQLFYHLEGYGEATFEQGLKLFEEYTADEVAQRNWTFNLPYYAERDHVDFTFPPHVDDIFTIDIPITVPCVSTEINVSVIIPEFISDSFTMFFVKVTGVNFTLPPNMKRVTDLCLYRDTGFDPSQCEPSNMIIATSPPTITRSEMEGPGVDEFLIYLGPVLYFLNSTEECLPNSMADNCTCLEEEEEIIITLSGHVADDSKVCDDILTYPLFENSSCGIFCENQTLADNMTSEYNYTVEVTTDLTPFQLRLNGVITWDIGGRDEIFPVNASMPAITVPINSFFGDAGDSYNLTFGVLHDSEYSSFTAYDLNYTFSVNPHLRPEENMTLCFFNGSSEPAHCEEAFLINLTISRCGDHPV